MNLPPGKNARQPERLDALPAQRSEPRTPCLPAHPHQKARRQETPALRTVDRLEILTTLRALSGPEQESLNSGDRVFDADARVLVEEKPGQSDS